MQDIAEAAGVSVTTVSHTLSGKRAVRPETAARIMRIVDDCGYVPDSAGRRLKTGRSGALALAVPDISQPYFGSIARGAEDEAYRRGYGLLVSSTADSDPRRESRYFALVRTRAVDGLLYTGSRDMSPGRDLIRLAEEGPVVLVDEEMPTLRAPAVASDNFEAGVVAGEHLVSLGHTRTLVISGPQGLKSQVERVQGFRRSFPNSLVLHGDFNVASGYSTIADAVTNGVDFTGVFATNDAMAIGAIRCLRERGIDVPAAVSVIGVDDVDLAGLVTPALTTVRQDTTQMGRTAVTSLLDWIETGEMPASTVLCVELVVRQSTAPAP
jgi:DNA-binding LacI/PurR family transcriptional regulator